MQRFFVFVICAVLLIFAASVTSFSHHDLPRAVPETNASSVAVGSCEDTAWSSAPIGLSVMPISRRDVALAADGSVESDVSVPFDSALTNSGTNSGSESEATAMRPVTPLERQRMVELIQRLFPDASEDAVQVWADVYAGTEPAEAEFLLEQKRILSGSRTLELPGANIQEPSSFAIPAADPQLTDPSAVSLIQTNLDCLRAIGYRRNVVLPEARSSRVDLSMQKMASLAFVTFRNFEQGPLIQSPLPAHVAVNSNDSSVMFHLEGHLVTRRGDFQKLSDGRIGLKTALGDFAIKDSPTVEAKVETLRILANGQIINPDDADSPPLGQLALVRVPDLHRLTSSDGVIFQYDGGRSESAVQLLPVAEVTLHTNCLELSNVHHDEDVQLMQQLK